MVTIQFDVFDLSFILLIAIYQTVSVIYKWSMLVFTCIKLVVYMLACAHAIARIKWESLSELKL